MKQNEKLHYWLRKRALLLKKKYQSSKFSKCVLGTLGVPENLSEGLLSKSYLHNNTEMLFALCTFILSQVYGGTFQRIHNVILYQTECTAHMRIYLSSIRSYIKVICKNAQQCHFSHCVFVLESIVIFIEMCYDKFQWVYILLNKH